MAEQMNNQASSLSEQDLNEYPAGPAGEAGGSAGGRGGPL